MAFNNLIITEGVMKFMIEKDPKLLKKAILSRKVIVPERLKHYLDVMEQKLKRA